MYTADCYTTVQRVATNVERRYSTFGVERIEMAATFAVGSSANEC